MPVPPCRDDPATILRQKVCLNAVSKDLKGEFTISVSKAQPCRVPECTTLKVVHQVTLAVRGHEPCDEVPALDGRIAVARLVTAFERDGTGRGFHAGDCTWTGAGLTVVGRLSGVTNVGTHRAPAFKECQRCNERGVMEGRLCGTVTKAKDPALMECQVVAAYRLRFDPSRRGGEGALGGTVEGVIVRPCR